MSEEGLYRRGVGVMLINDRKDVWVGRRIDNTDDAWQMPQGGIDKGEKPWATAKRELEEETGISPRLVERIAECPEQLKYDLPEEIRQRMLTEGFIRISATLHSDRYALPEQISRVHEDHVHLTVAFDDLLKVP